ncbi:hypothetical protein PTKIN_Ptkin16aG0513000 [Pterospermum kingtungense]
MATGIDGDFSQNISRYPTRVPDRSLSLLILSPRSNLGHNGFELCLLDSYFLYNLLTIYSALISFVYLPRFTVYLVVCYLRAVLLPDQVFKSLHTMDDVIDLTGDGGVLKKTVTRAKAGALAPSEDLPMVDVHYEGTLAETGEVFDTTHEDNSVFSFELGKGTVIQAWDIALKTMKVGEVAKITCKPEYAYGAAGSPPDIPPNATLIFEVELLSCRPRKGSSLGSASEERARLEELKKQREIAAATKEEEKKKREEAKAAAAARIQAKLEAKKGQGKGKGKAK